MALNTHSFNHTFILALFLLSLLSTFADARSVRIDDSDSTYWTFTGSWHTISPAAPCTNCWAKPDASRIYQQTWHDGGVAGKAGGRIEYFGTTISIFGVLTDLKAANIRFQLDGGAAVLYLGQEKPGFAYDVLLYQAPDSGENKRHVLTWALETSSFNGIVGIMDYAILTVQDEVVTRSEIVQVTPTETHDESPTSTTQEDLTTSDTQPTDSTDSPGGISDSTTTDIGTSSERGLSPGIPTSGTSPSTSGSPALSTNSVTDAARNSNANNDPPSPENAEVKGAANDQAGTPIGAIVGGVAGGIVLILAIALLFCLRRKSQRQRQDSLNRTLLGPGVLGAAYSDNLDGASTSTRDEDPEKGQSQPLYPPVPQHLGTSNGRNVQMSYDGGSRTDLYTYSDTPTSATSPSGPIRRSSISKGGNVQLSYNVRNEAPYPAATSNTTSDTSEPIVRRSSISKGGHVQLSYNGGSRHELHNYPAAPESETTSLADTSNSTYLEMRVRELEQRLAVIDPDVHGPPPSY